MSMLYYKGSKGSAKDKLTVVVVGIVIIQSAPALMEHSLTAEYQLMLVVACLIGLYSLVRAF